MLSKKKEAVKDKTIGQLSSNIDQVSGEAVESLGNEKEAFKDFLPTLWDTVRVSKISYPDKDIFIEVYREIRPALKTAVNHFRSRTTCPKPQYNQIVFHYKNNHESIDLLWSLPDEGTCRQIKQYALDVDPEYIELRDFIIDFYDGTLEKKVREINKTHIFKENILLTLDDDKKLEAKEKHKKKLKEINDRRKRVKLY